MANAPALNFPITATDKTARAFNAVNARVKGLTGAFTGLKAAIAVVGIGALTGKTIAVAREFEVLRASLKTVTGSAANATAAFEMVQEFAATTPFSVQQATEAFIRLRSLGLEPSREALISYGNTASAMGKNLIQYVEAIADATTGEFERLKEFGIKASTEGENVSFTFQGVTTTVKKNADEIEAYLRKIGENEFAGAMSERAKTLDGALSNLSDSTAVLADRMGQGGLAEGVAAVARQFAEVNGRAGDAAESFGRLSKVILVNFAESVPAALDTTSKAMTNLLMKFEQAPADLEYVQGRMAKITQTIRENNERIANFKADWIPDAVQDIDILEARNASLTEEYNRLVDQYQKLQASTDDQAAANDNLQKSFEGVKKSVEGVTEAGKKKGESDEAEKALDRMAKRVKRQVETPIETLNRELADLDKLLTAGKISWEEYGRAVEDAWSRAETSTDQSADEVKTKTIDVYEEVGDVVKDVFRDGRVEAAGFKDVALDALESVIDKLLEMQSFDFGDIISGDEGGFGIGNIFSKAVSAATGFFGGGGGGADPFAFEGIRARAHGGPVTGGGGYMVGENGPEYFRPAVSGSIVPTGKLSRGGSVTVQVITNINAPGAELGFEDRVRAVLRDETPGLISRAVSSVEYEAGRGGGFAKSMGRRAS